MSVSIYFSNDNLEDSEIFPFSGEMTFRTFWKKMIAKFDFKIIGLFNVEFDDEMYEIFLKELHTVKEYLESLPENEENARGKLTHLNFILDTLREERPKYKYVYIA